MKSTKHSLHPTALALACLASAILPAQAGASADEPQPTLLHCGHDTCLAVSNAMDSDGDQVSDDDERAAGTDPYDAASTPRLPKLIDLMARDKLPSFQSGRTVLIVLPTMAPNGKSILGGAAALPGRQNTLAALGITGDRVAGLNLSNGLAIGRSTKPASPGKPPMKIGGINMGLYAAGGSGKPMTSIVGTAVNLSPNNREPIDDITNSLPVSFHGATSGSSLFNFSGGNKDMVTWYSNSTTQQAKVDSYDASGKLIGGSSYSSSSYTTDGIKTTEERKTWSNTSNGTGGTEVATTTTSADGATAIRDFNKTETKKGAGGSTITEKTSASTVYENGRPVDGTSTKVVTTCKDGVCNNTVKTDVYTECPDTACNGGTNAYVSQDDTSYDPSTDLRRMGLTVAQTVNVSLAVLGGNITFGETPKEEILDEPPASTTSNGPLVIFVDDDPSSNGGSVLVGVGDPRKLKIIEPRIDPNLPDPVESGTMPLQSGNCHIDRTC